jgi:hypothetical protein
MHPLIITSLDIHKCKAILISFNTSEKPNPIAVNGDIDSSLELRHRQKAGSNIV